MPLSESDEALAEALIDRLKQVGVATTYAEAAELAAAYPALEAWMRIASELAAEDPQRPQAEGS